MYPNEKNIQSNASFSRLAISIDMTPHIEMDRGGVWLETLVMQKISLQ